MNHVYRILIYAALAAFRWVMWVPGYGAVALGGGNRSDDYGFCGWLEVPCGPLGYTERLNTRTLSLGPFRV